MSEGELFKASEYRRRTTKIITVPSGFQFVIRKVPAKTLMKLMSLYEGKPNTDEAMRKILPDVLKVLLPDCVAHPKVVLENPQGNEILLDEIEARDAIELVTQITNFSGLTGPMALERETFRQEPTGTSARPTVSSTETPK